jgi:hypothetical protein
VAFPFDLVRIHLSFIAVTLAFAHPDTAAADIKLRSRSYRITGCQRSRGRTPRSAAR